MPRSMKKKEIKKEFENEVLDISRVERMTAGGRRLRFRTMVVVGNKKGQVGVGTAKGHDVQQSIEKATKKAQKSVVKVLISGGTIPHEVKAKYGAAVVLLKPQSEGRGLVAGGTVRTICSMAGIENISGKILGNTRNKLNNAKAAIKALEMLKYSSKEEGKKEENNEIDNEKKVIEKNKEEELKEKKKKPKEGEKKTSSKEKK